MFTHFKPLNALLLAYTSVGAIVLNVNETDSIISASKIVVSDILRIYNANSTGPDIPGLFPAPYRWWEAGLAFDSLINYWWLSGDDSVVAVVQDGLLFQISPNDDYM